MNLIPKINGRVKMGEGIAIIPEDGGQVTFFSDESIPSEGYRLTIGKQDITLASSDETGRFYGLVTLKELARYGSGSIACMEIEDAPRFGWRGLMLDVSRHFFPVEEIKRVLDQMARLKMNRFHWHLSDDQGFRIESKVFPKLNEVGSWWNCEDGTKYGGFYTQEEIRDVVEYAAAKHIMVVPEIDLPGHTSAIVASYPELSCDKQPGEVKSVGGIYPRILCAGDPAVYEFLYALLDEVTGLFPAPYFHLGGDEAPKSEWKKCEQCQAMIKENGLSGEEGLQAYFTKQLVDYLAGKGKTAIGWNEILKSGELATDTICQYWAEMGEPYCYPHVAKGQKFIFSNNPCLYLDYPHSMVTMKSCLLMDPNVDWKFDIPKEQVLGVETALWAERVPDPETLEIRIFPRMAAVAENGWTKERNYREFVGRLKAYGKTLEEDGIRYTPIPDADLRGRRRMKQVGEDMKAMKESGMAEAADNLPPEMKKEIMKGAAKFIKGFFYYSFRNKSKG